MSEEKSSGKNTWLEDKMTYQGRIPHPSRAGGLGDETEKTETETLTTARRPDVYRYRVTKFDVVPGEIWRTFSVDGLASMGVAIW